MRKHNLLWVWNSRCLKKAILKLISSENFQPKIKIQIDWVLLKLKLSRRDRPNRLWSANKLPTLVCQNVCHPTTGQSRLNLETQSPALQLLPNLVGGAVFAAQRKQSIMMQTQRHTHTHKLITTACTNTRTRKYSFKFAPWRSAVWTLCSYGDVVVCWRYLEVWTVYLKK